MKEIAPALPAATILLLRDFEGELQVFMQQRAWEASFVGGAYVFPGGKVDEDDMHFPEELLRHPEASHKEILLQKPDAQVGVVAALRECFEEAGILLAYQKHSNEVVQLSDSQHNWQSLRDGLNNKEINWSALIKQQALELAVDQLVFIGHWITPASSPQRFDTLFFAAKAPEDQQGIHDDFESINSIWWTPKAALEAYSRKEIQLISPTRVTLEHAAQFSSSDDFIEHFRMGLTVLERD